MSPFERSLSTTVNDIEHIESQSLAGYGVVKIYFQPTVNINAAQAQVTSISQTILKQLPAGITPPADPQLQRVERADHTGRSFQRHAVPDAT